MFHTNLLGDIKLKTVINLVQGDASNSEITVIENKGYRRRRSCRAASALTILPLIFSFPTAFHLQTDSDNCQLIKRLVYTTVSFDILLTSNVKTPPVLQHCGVDGHNAALTRAHQSK